MKFGHRVFLLILCVFLSLCSMSWAEVEWSPTRTLKLEAVPLDTAVSARGRWTFVLTDKGQILVYSAQGELKEKIDVGTHIDGIRAGSRDDVLVLTSGEKKTVQVGQVSNPAATRRPRRRSHRASAASTTSGGPIKKSKTPK